MKKNRFLAVSAGIVLAFSACTPKVSQNTSEIELGSSVNLADFITTDENTTAFLSDDNDFNMNKTGSFTAKFDVTDKNGKVTNQTFTFKVVDTTPPDLEVSDTILVPMGVDFDINSYAKASDISENVNITVSPRVDTSKEGEYAVTVTAKDASGNETKKDVAVTVAKRENTAFRNACWGDDEATIRSLESAPFTLKDGDAIGCSNQEISGLDANIWYFIDSEYGLYCGSYQFTSRHSNANRYISDFKTIKENMVKVYGEPASTEEPCIIDSGYYYCDDEGQALSIDYSYYLTTWEIPETNTEISLELYTDNYQIVLGVWYTDTRYEADNTGGL